MFNNCSQKYSDLLNLYGDLNLYSAYNINFLTITPDFVSSFVLSEFQKQRYVCFLDDLNLIQEKSVHLRNILNTCVITFTPYDIPRITGWLERYVKFDPVFDENEYVSINLGDRTTELLVYDMNQSYSSEYLNNVKFVRFDDQLNPFDYLVNKTITESVLRCVLCGCMVNIQDLHLLSLIGDNILDRVNKSTFEYSSYSYCSSKILEKYSYLASVDYIDNTIIGIFGNPYMTGE